MMAILLMVTATGNEGFFFVIFVVFFYFYFFHYLPILFLETIRSCDFGDFDEMMTISSIMTASEGFWE
jgi:hypothetical protein